MTCDLYGLDSRSLPCASLPASSTRHQCLSSSAPTPIRLTMYDPGALPTKAISAFHGRAQLRPSASVHRWSFKGDLPVGAPVILMMSSCLRRPFSSMIASTLSMRMGRYRSASAMRDRRLAGRHRTRTKSESPMVNVVKAPLGKEALHLGQVLGLDVGEDAVLVGGEPELALVHLGNLAKTRLELVSRVVLDTAVLDEHVKCQLPSWPCTQP